MILFSLISNSILKEAPLNYPLTISPASLSIFCQQHKSANMGISFMTFDPFLYVTFLYINVKTLIVSFNHMWLLCSFILFLNKFPLEFCCKESRMFSRHKANEYQDQCDKCGLYPYLCLMTRWLHHCPRLTLHQSATRLEQFMEGH